MRRKPNRLNSYQGSVRIGRSLETLEDRLLLTATVPVAPVIETGPQITLNPVSTPVVLNNPVTFTAAASGNPTPTVQWEVMAPYTSWQNVPGANSTTLTFTPTANQDGYQYRRGLHEWRGHGDHDQRHAIRANAADVYDRSLVANSNPGRPGQFLCRLQREPCTHDPVGGGSGPRKHVHQHPRRH